MSHTYSLQYGTSNPYLRTPCDPVGEYNSEILGLIRALRRGVFEHDGIGLAAPQIGKPWRIIAITERNKSGKKMIRPQPRILINPIIISTSKEMITREEGCLSLPGTYGKVARHKSITVSYLDVNKKKHTKTWSNFTAAIIQHEIDHLNGVLFIDKLVT